MNTIVPAQHRFRPKTRKAFSIKNVSGKQQCPDCGIGHDSERGAAMVILDLHTSDTGQGVAVPCPCCEAGLELVGNLLEVRTKHEIDKQKYRGMEPFWPLNPKAATHAANKVSWNNGRTLHGRYCFNCREWESWQEHEACVAGIAKDPGTLVAHPTRLLKKSTPTREGQPV